MWEMQKDVTAIFFKYFYILLLKYTDALFIFIPNIKNNFIFKVKLN